MKKMHSVAGWVNSEIDCGNQNHCFGDVRWPLQGSPPREVRRWGSSGRKLLVHSLAYEARTLQWRGIMSIITTLRHFKKKELTNMRDSESCTFGKSIWTPRKSATSQEKAAAKELEPVYTDVMGPMKQKSLGKARYLWTYKSPTVASQWSFSFSRRAKP